MDRFIASQAIALALPGIPGIYIHSLLGSRNWQGGVLQTGQNRSINREKLDLATVERELGEAGGFRHQVFRRYGHLLRTRRRLPAFSPEAEAQVLPVGRCIFGLARTASAQRILALTNVTERAQAVDVAAFAPSSLLTELLSGGEIKAKRVELRPYQTVWLTR